MPKIGIAILLLIALTGCAGLQKASSSISKADPEAICGPAPTAVARTEADRMLALDAWLTDHMRATRPEDLDLFQRRYLAEPTQLRRQVRTCRGLVAGQSGT